MKKNEELKKVVQDENCEVPVLCAPVNSITSVVGKYLRKFIYLTCLAGIGTLFTGCMGGYIASEPAYVQYERPARPSNVHIWIDGDWGWNSQSHVYVQKAGYWEKPRQGQMYVAGSWQTNSKGKSWSKGHWQKDNRNGGNGRR